MSFNCKHYSPPSLRSNDFIGCSQRIKPIPMSEKFKALSVGSPVVLQCELQDPVAQVSWCKDGVELYSKTGLDMKRNGHVRKLVINSAKASDSGLYSCCLSLDVVTFQVEVQGDCCVCYGLSFITIQISSNNNNNDPFAQQVYTIPPSSSYF